MRMHANTLAQFVQALKQPNAKVRRAPLTKLNYECAQVLAAHRFIESFQVIPDSKARAQGQIILNGHLPNIELISKPSQRLYFDLETLLGEKDTFRYMHLRAPTALTILRTPLGVRSLQAAKYLRVGGEPLLVARLV